jgi:sugar phosphate isomerase/epimerase
MIRVSISTGFGEGNRYNIETIPENIQWALYKYDFYQEADLEFLERNNINVNVVHLPLDTLKRDPDPMFDLMDKINNRLGTKKFVIHPNKLIKSFLHYYMDNIAGKYPKYKLCIENFQWRKKKVFRSPLEILEYCIQYPLHLAMCLDTSHTEELWFDHKILHTILPYTEVIHLSNRNYAERKQHMPFNTGTGDLNLMAFVNHLKFINWNGDIVLEYMPDYKDKIYKNYLFLKEHFNG